MSASTVRLLPFTQKYLKKCEIFEERLSVSLYSRPAQPKSFNNYHAYVTKMLLFSGKDNNNKKKKKVKSFFCGCGWLYSLRVHVILIKLKLKTRAEVNVAQRK